MSSHRAVRPRRTSRLGLVALTGAAALGLGVGPAAGLSFAAGADKNCSDFQYQEDAQDYYDQDTSDPSGLDGSDNDGKACEGNEHRPTSSTGSSAATSDVSTRTSPSSSKSSTAARSASAAGSSAGLSSTASRAAASSATDRDCADFDSQAEAQDVLDADPSDPERLDADDDGQACESYGYGDAATSDSSSDSDDTVVAEPVADTDDSTVTQYPAGGVAAGDGSGESGSEALYYGLLTSAAVAGAFGARQLAGGRHRRTV